MASLDSMIVGQDPDEYRKRLASMLVQQGLSTEPIRSHWQGAARLAQALVGGLQLNQLRNENRQAGDELVKSLPGLSEPTVAPSPVKMPDAPASVSAPPYEASAEGPVTPNIDQPKALARALMPEGYGKAATSEPGVAPSAVKMPDAKTLGTALGAPPSASSEAPKTTLVGSNPDYASALKMQESNNNPLAKNPNSSALGLGQFTTGTWDDLAKRSPQLGLTPDGRTDPVQANKAIDAFTAENADALKASGIDPTPQNLYMSHFLGTKGGPAFISGMAQNPTAPATSLVSPEAARANRSVFFNQDGSPRTAQQVFDLQTRRFAPQGQQPQAMPIPNAVPGQDQAQPIPNWSGPPPVQMTNGLSEGRPVQAMPTANAAPAQMPGQPAPGQQRGGPLIPPEVAQAIRNAVSSENPTVRAFGMQLYSQYAKPQQYGFQTLPDGTMVRTDPRGGTVTEVYKAPSKPTWGVVGEDQFGNKQHGWIDPYKRSVEAVQLGGSAGANAPATVTDAKGNVLTVPAGQDPKKFREHVTTATADAMAGKLTEVQANATQFANRMEDAERNVQKYAGAAHGLSGTVGGAARGVTAGQYNPIPRAATNWAVPKEYEQLEQAKSQFITALLRKESGAAIGATEFDRYEREFFPQLGDSADVVAQKAHARSVAINAMKKGAGPVYQSPPMSAQPQAASAAHDPLGIR
jgi:hypothetical protein